MNRFLQGPNHVLKFLLDFHIKFFNLFSRQIEVKKKNQNERSVVSRPTEFILIRKKYKAG